MIGKAFVKEVGNLIRYDAKVTRIQQDAGGVTVTYTDAKNSTTPQQAKADWCVCTIPLSILSQLPLDVGPSMKAAIDAVPYSSAVKIGLQFKRRFWEEDEAIYGGISYTDLPIRQIAYPNTGFNRAGKGVLLGAYLFDGANAYEFTAMPPAERVARAVEFGAVLHPQYRAEFENGVAVAWHRMPFTLGLRRRLDRADEGGALRQSVPDRRPDRAGGRARLLHSGLAGGSDFVFSQRHHPAACARGQDVRPNLKIHALFVVAMADIFSLSSFAASAQSTGFTLSEGYRFSETSGEGLFVNVCRGCHMADGKGAVGAGTYPSLAGNKILKPAPMPSASSSTACAICRRSDR